MPIRREKFEKGLPIHVISRVIEGRTTFKEEDDCFRFIFQLYAANIGKPAKNIWREDIIKAAKAILNGEDISSKFIIKEHDPFVYFLDFSLVINHCHLYLVPAIDNILPVLMKKINGNFSQYYNLKHARKGTLFDGRYQSVLVKTQSQSDAVSRYVNTINPLDVFQPGWREEGLTNPKRAFQFLRSYQFSSFPDKIGERRSKILGPPEILEKYLSLGPRDVETYREFVDDFLKERSKLPKSLFLE